MTHLKIDDSAIPFTLRGVDGKMHSLVDYGHRIAVAVVFSCNHCPYVQAWEDRMIAIQSDYADDGFHMIAINANDANAYPADSFAEMVKRAKAKNFNFPYLIDETQEVAKAYGAERTPEVFLFGPGRTLRYHGAIDDNYARPNEVKHHYLRDAIDAVFEGIRPPFETTPPVGCTIKWR
jgi:peroxiredoxin